MKLLLLIIFLSGCIPTNTRKRDFKTNPVKATVNQRLPIRIDGVYYGFHKNLYSNDYDLSYFFFYNNGVMRNVVSKSGVRDTMDTIQIITIIKNDSRFKDSLFRDRKDGGAFLIDSNSIKMQDYIYIPGSLSWDLRTFVGRIINDTSIYITDCQITARPDYCARGYYLKFMPAEKPDSTNRLMKKRWYWKNI